MIISTPYIILGFIAIIIFIAGIYKLLKQDNGNN